MSHNKIKVAGQEPNASGEISVALDNLSDVSASSPSNGDFLKYNDASNEWENVAVASSSSVEILFFGQGGSVNYPETLSSGNNVYFYGTSGNFVNTIGATLGQTTSTSAFDDWYDQFTLPAGDYVLQGSLHGDFSGASGEAKYQFREGANNRGASGVNLHPSNTSGTEYPAEAVSYVTLTSSTTIVLRITDVTDSTTPTSLQCKRGYLLIMKVN
jgi:FlaG/FlaF family flagellin (archaellin)|tara:strand:+ start:122 stop:763 length:642 start_codon:yes stop_codon:yes gene_type:complete